MIPADWLYEDGLPVAALQEVAEKIVVSCPSCPNGIGYKASVPCWCFEKKVLECTACGTKFIGLE